MCFPVSFISSSGKVSSIETFRPFCRIEMDRIVRIQPMQYIHLLDLVRASKIKFDVQICLNTAVYLETFLITLIVVFYLIYLVDLAEF